MTTQRQVNNISASQIMFLYTESETYIIYDIILCRSIYVYIYTQTSTLMVTYDVMPYIIIEYKILLTSFNVIPQINHQADEAKNSPPPSSC